MKKLALAITFAVLANTANADGIEDPVVTPEVIIEEVTEDSSTVNLLIPLLALILITAAQAN